MDPAVRMAMVGTLTFPASPETPHQRLQSAICVEKMLGHTIRMTLRFSLSSLHFSLAAAAFQNVSIRPAPVGRSVGKLLWKTLANTIRLSNRERCIIYYLSLSTKNCKKCSFICFSIHFGGKNSVPLYLRCLPQQTNSLIFVEVSTGTGLFCG